VTRFRSRVSSNSNASPPGNRKQGRSLASNVEHSFFIKHLCWAARRMGRDRASVPRSMAPNEEPVCAPSDALDAQSNYLASLRGRKIASALGTSITKRRGSEVSPCPLWELQDGTYSYFVPIDDAVRPKEIERHGTSGGEED
jgi:hypothetical protein